MQGHRVGKSGQRRRRDYRLTAQSEGWQTFAESIGSSPRTVFQDLKFGKAWIAGELGKR